MIIYDKAKLPERIWIYTLDGIWTADKIYGSDNVEYIRADFVRERINALLELSAAARRGRRAQSRRGDR